MSRATDLGFRHPSDVTQNMYLPKVNLTFNNYPYNTNFSFCFQSTYTGTKIVYDPNDDYEALKDLRSKFVPFKSSEERFEYSKLEKKKQSLLPGPANYDQLSSFKKLKPFTCGVKYVRDTGPEDSPYILVGGARRVLSPGFLNHKEKRRVMGWNL